MSIRVAILGYGNLGRGMECAVKQNDDMELVAVFTRRDPATVKTLTDVKVYNVDQLLSMQDQIDVLVLCGGSATDLPKQTAEYAKYFNVVDSFDTHAKIPEHFAQVDTAAKEGGKVAMISVGWDPGMFSLNRLYANAILRDGSDYTFWGKGVSQGHSDAIRRIPGVKDAKQYTIPVEAALEAVRNCENPVLTTRQKHTRECFVVAEEGADKAQIPEHFAQVDTAAKEGGKVAMISVGWDPGMFSLNRLYANAILRDGSDYTFWGKGVSQGHSDAIRRIPGVKDAKQYTIPVEAALEAVRNCENPVLTTRQKHTRECFVVAEEGADKAQIEEQIKTMPNYFADYDTTVHFITEEELQRDHAGIPHGGFVLRTGKTGLNGEHDHVIEYSLKLDSNPEFTSCVLTAYARAAYRMNQEGQKGCKTVFDVAPAYLSTLTPEEMRSTLL